MESVIEFKSISKKYKRGRRLFLKQALLDLFRPNKQEDFWALKDISFKIRKSETVGIIGDNGSGKSTILKLIAGVVAPTSGWISVNGKVSPLIELGAGFHPELTGRENIYLNGTILGLTEREIDKKFDEIVAFSELENFIDTPVKHYSSGMYMRLGFSIAISVDPDILLIDEILAVGDISFQKKCFEKIKEFKRKEKTIVIISHSMEVIRMFCEKAMLIRNGRCIGFGDTKKLVGSYIKYQDNS
ncbi:MAG: hypothetical protein ACD_31C00002G0009 [uncultured bacterium]|uniref:Polysaccharide ABC transporter ATP-binding protein n=2 Tax=Candidatus Daviesiibacteriota TaxID=1752718 RepID=A0A0G0EMB4_9BACT|nr:MAG: hypothetical protein ACD_31C00002G0009 [uncultured bacterium]KKQ08173.1 MAG: Polysaccharide ABC transporter ATP-binding protein [Candidatus Daviesbacteria bacterium GW2011_GWB1_36_5]KKQ15635.1 MAG: Polysaccharide ABC transporter ATP-binding protein [Candidatus Daviesbacteria bacterium GW2011_GWA1_36_8]